MTRPLPRPYESWEHDDAYQALGQWIAAWRQQNPKALRPGLEFTKHIGLEAVSVAKGMTKVELLRLFAAVGFEGQCVCGLHWTATPPPVELSGDAA